MDWLQSIPGSTFLPLYILYLVLLLLAAKTIFFPSGTTSESLSDLDLISIAYLKGGPAGVVQNVFFDLWNRGCIEVAANGQAVIHADKGRMSELESTIARELTTYTSVSIGLRKPGAATRKKLEPYLEPVARALEDNGLVMNNAARIRQKALKWVFLAAGLVPGVSKAYLGFTHNRPSGFLVLTLLVYTVVVFILMRARKGATPRARQYLRNLAGRYKGDLDILREGQVPQTNPSVLAAIFGVGALAVAYSPLVNLFPVNRASGCSGYSSYGCTHTGGCTTAGCSNSSGCSSSSSGCSSSSGGGGCGGCGGGGN